MGLLDLFRKRDQKKDSGLMRIELYDPDMAPDDLYGQMPVRCTVLRQMPAKDRPDYFLARCDEPISYGERKIRYIILRTRFVGTILHRNMDNMAINVAYVTDESLLKDRQLEFKKCEYVAICMGRDVSE